MKIKNMLIILLGILFASSCFAGIKITPVKAKLSNNKQSASIQLKNTGNAPLVFRSDIAKKIKGTLVSNKDILVVPKVVNIKPNEEKTVRFRLRKKVARPDTYYLTLLRKAKPSEVKLAVADGKIQPNVRLNVQLDIPISVTPKS